MRCELVCSQRSIGQTSQVGAELAAQGEETGGPRIEDSCRWAVTGSLKNSVEDRAADDGPNEAVAVLLNGEGSGLRHEVPGRFAEFSSFKERLERIFVKRGPDKVTKWPGRELKQMRRMAQRVLDTRQLACRDLFDTNGEGACAKRRRRALVAWERRMFRRGG